MAKNGMACTVCAATPLCLNGIRSPFLFTGVIRQAIHAFKYRDVSAFAPVLGHLLADYLTQNPIAADVIVPVPLYERKRRERGFDQSELLADYLVRETGLLSGKGWVMRQRATTPQVKASGAAERRRNMAGAFALGPGFEPGRRLLLLDDVCTTGATLDSCAQALKSGGAATIWGLTVARDS